MNEAKVFDKEAALNRVDNDKELLQELIALFFEEYPAQIRRIETAIQNQDTKELEEAAHAIKSALGNIGAMRCYELAFSLEKSGKTAELSGVRESFDKLVQEVEGFRIEAEKLLN
ncbi:MAG: Hpt domain-containing protein [Candidatus Dadabacteria bacterium]|nr:MAG: Hpt domain-containing protein [Candidatus Dadabacteria bacterium]